MRECWRKISDLPMLVEHRALYQHERCAQITDRPLTVRFAEIMRYREQLGCDHLLSFSKGCGTSSKTMLCLVHRSGRGRLMPPQGRD